MKTMNVNTNNNWSLCSYGLCNKDWTEFFPSKFKVIKVKRRKWQENWCFLCYFGHHVMMIILYYSIGHLKNSKEKSAVNSWTNILFAPAPFSDNVWHNAESRSLEGFLAIFVAIFVLSLTRYIVSRNTWLQLWKVFILLACFEEYKQRHFFQKFSAHKSTTMFSLANHRHLRCWCASDL